MLIPFHQLENGYSYAIDDSTYEVWYKTKGGKIDRLKRHTASRFGVSVPLMFYDESVGRNRTNLVPLTSIILKHIFKAEQCVVEFVDGNKQNFTPSNIKVVPIVDYCNDWCKMDNKLMIASNGLLYSVDKAQFIPPTIIQDYAYYNILSRHYKRSHLVWQYFGHKWPLPKGYVVDHIDNVPLHDDIKNLQCITIRENLVKEIIRNRKLPTGVTKNGNKYAAHISYTFNGTYHEGVFLGSFSTAEEAGNCYKRACAIVESGKDPIKHGPDSNIHYSFADDTWWFVAAKRGQKTTTKYRGYKTYEEAYVSFTKLSEINVALENCYDKAIRRGYFTVRFGEKGYDITKRKYGDIEFVNAMKAYKSSRAEGRVVEFINDIPLWRERILTEDRRVRSEIERDKSDARIQRMADIAERRAAKEIEAETNRKQRLSDFMAWPNYKQNTYNDGYTFNVHAIDGKSYYIASFMDPEIVTEIDTLMNSHRFSNDFGEWVTEFKETVLPDFKKRDSVYRSEKINKTFDNKGYRWFKARNCWRVLKSVENNDFLLGYFRKEESCRQMIKEANNAIQMGLFTEWYSRINEHRDRIRSMFGDEKLSRSKRNNVSGAVQNPKTPTVHAIEQLLNGEVIATFDTFTEAARQFHNSAGDKEISRCCRGLKKSYLGYEWRFKTPTI